MVRRLLVPVLALGLAIGAVLLPVPALARDFAYLSDKQLSQLRAVGIPIIIPATLPPGYTLSQFDVSSEDKEYTLHFRGPAHRSMFVAVAVSGFGDAAPDYTTFRRSFDATSSVLGKAHFEPIELTDEWIWAASYLALSKAHPESPLMNIGGDSSSDLKLVYGALKTLPKR